MFNPGAWITLPNPGPIELVYVTRKQTSLKRDHYQSVKFHMKESFCLGFIRPIRIGKRKYTNEILGPINPAVTNTKSECYQFGQGVPQ